MQNEKGNYLDSSLKLFRYYKSLGEGAINQIDDKGMHWQFNSASNSIATIVKHMAGNSISRWTDFLTADGEKEWRNRDGEFADTIKDKAELLALWNRGWECLFTAIEPLTEADLSRIIYIRNEGHTVLEAINRQLAHLPYHVGQLVYIAKMLTDSNWQSLSIPKGQSKNYNKDKFADKKQDRFFTDGMK